MQYTSTMTSKGQVTVPAAFRRKLGIKPGETVRLSISGNSVKVEATDWRKDLKELQVRIHDHMKRKNLPFPPPEDWQKVREQAWRDAATERSHRPEKQK